MDNLDQTIRDITSDENAVKDIIKSVNNDPEAYASMLMSMENDPKSKKKLLNAISSTPELIKQVDNMDPTEKAVLAIRTNEGRAKALAERIQTVQIMQNGKIKKFTANSDFPTNTIFEGGDYYTLDNNIIVFTTTMSRQKNKVATQVLKYLGAEGVDVFGELVFFILNKNGKSTSMSSEHLEKIKSLALVQK